MVRAMDRYLRRTIVCAALLLAAAIGAPGCHWGPQSTAHGESLLKPVGESEDSVELEIISVRFSPHDDDLTSTMWNEIDEQQMPLAARRELTENGFRSGIVSGQLPASLAKVVATAEKQPDSVTEAAARLHQSSPVSRQKMQLHSGWRGEIVASNVYPELPLFTHEEGLVSGHTYPQAQGIFSAKAKALGDRRITLLLVPQLQYGQEHQTWVSEDGRLLPQAGKPKHSFERLALDATLAADQMLVVTAMPDCSGTLGHYFFTEPQAGVDNVQQKLIIIRLANSRYDDLFAPAANVNVEPEHSTEEPGSADPTNQASDSATKAADKKTAESPR